MKSSDRILGIYAVSAVAAAAYSIYQGKNLSDVAMDTLLGGGVLGTAANVGVFLIANEPVKLATSTDSAYGLSLPNPMAVLNTAKDLGNMSKQAVAFLSHLDENLYYPFRENGVKMGPIPSNPSLINQDD